MANAVLPTMEKLLPPTDTTAKKAQSKPSSDSSFDTALNKARPKPAAKQENPEEKKAVRATKKKGDATKPQKVAAKDKADTDTETEEAELEGKGGEATQEGQQEEAPTEEKTPVAKGAKQDAKAQATDEVTISDQAGQVAAQAAQSAQPVAKAVSTDDPAQ